MNETLAGEVQRGRELGALLEPEYITGRQLAELLQVSEKSLYRWAAADPSMPVLRLGGRTIRFPRARVVQWLKSREQGPGRPRRLRAVGEQAR